MQSGLLDLDQSWSELQHCLKDAQRDELAYVRWQHPASSGRWNTEKLKCNNFVGANMDEYGIAAKLRLRLATAICIEIVYVVFSRVWLRGHFYGIELELLVTACRLASLVAYWWLFREFLSRTQIKRRPRPTFLLYCGIASLLMVPLLFFGGYSPDLSSRIIFALTSIVVSCREEVFYRGVIQSILERRLGFPLAIISTNVVFVLYHFGAQPFTASGVTELFTMGCVMGILYKATGTLIAPIVMHGVYDAMWSFGPILAYPLPDIFRIPFHLLGAILVFAWTRTQMGRQETAT
jgi:membrane protease YdiL (CAAX protease family)